MTALLFLFGFNGYFLSLMDIDTLSSRATAYLIALQGVPLGIGLAAAIRPYGSGSIDDNLEGLLQRAIDSIASEGQM